MRCPSISTLYNHRFFQTTQDPESQQIQPSPGTRAVKAAVPIAVNSLGFTGKVVAIATGLTLATLLAAHTTISEEHGIITVLHDAIDSVPYLGQTIGFIGLGLIPLGAKKASNVLAQQTSLPKIAILIGQGAIYASLTALYASILADVIFNYDLLMLPELLKNSAILGLLPFGTYHAIELITQGQEHVKQKLA